MKKQSILFLCLTLSTMNFALQTVAAIRTNDLSASSKVTSSAPVPPTGPALQSYCAIDFPTVADLIATGANIKWYSVPIGGISLTPNTNLTNGTIYYATQTVGGFESTNRLAVTAMVSNPAAPTATSPQSFCASSNAKVADLFVTDTAIKWYNAPIGGNLIAGGTTLADGTTYYASQTIAGCESSTRLAVTTMVSDPAAPTATSPQSFCASSNAKVADLIVTGTAIKWYNAPIGGSLVSTSTALADGTTYYASQTIAGCESSTRLAVTTMVSDPAAPTANSVQSFCASSNAKVADLIVTGTATHWYDAPTGGNLIAGGTALADGTTYYASQTIAGCESSTRIAVTAVISPLLQVTLSSAVGTDNQTTCNNATISNISYVTSNATGINNDGVSGANGLPPGVSAHWVGNTITISGTPTVSGTFIYSIGINGGCGTENATGTITVNSLPTNSVIIGNATPGCNTSGEVYSVTNTPGSTYAWSVPTGSTITSGQGTNAVTITFGSNNGDVSVIETKASGCVGTPVIKSILLVGCGINADFNADKNVVCVGDTVTFMDISTSTTSSTSYSWSFGLGANPVSAQGKGPHAVIYTTSGPKDVSLTLSDGILTTETKSSYITVNPLLGSVIFNSGPSTICEFSTATKYIATAANANTITYSVSPPTAGSIDHSTGVMKWSPTFVGKTRIIATANGLCKSVTDSLEVTVNPILPVSVSILADQNPVCTGTTVNFTATPTNGGIAPNYQWRLNGISVGINSATYSYTPINGDVVQVEMTSNASPCISGSPASSNAVVLTVNTCVPTGVDEQTIKNDNKNLTELYVSNQLLYIKNAQVGEQIRVTSTLGIVIYSGVITTNELTVSLPQHGVYVVTIGSKSQSVVY